MSNCTECSRELKDDEMVLPTAPGIYTCAECVGTHHSDWPYPAKMKGGKAYFTCDGREA